MVIVEQLNQSWLLIFPHTNGLNEIILHYKELGIAQKVLKDN